MFIGRDTAETGKWAKIKRPWVQEMNEISLFTIQNISQKGYFFEFIRWVRLKLNTVWSLIIFLYLSWFLKTPYIKSFNYSQYVVQTPKPFAREPHVNNAYGLAPFHKAIVDLIFLPIISFLSSFCSIISWELIRIRNNLENRMLNGLDEKEYLFLHNKNVSINLDYRERQR